MEGVYGYAIGKAEVTVNFPNGKVACQNCEFCQVERYRAKCLLRHGAVVPLEFIGTIDADCPLTFSKTK